SLLTGFVLGALRFVFEIVDKVHGGGHYFTNSLVRWMVDMNFLHYAIVMFLVCSGVLVLVSLMGVAPERSKIAGLTFATMKMKVDASQVEPVLLRDEHKPAPETALEHRINVTMSTVLVAVVVGLWIYFR
ncbi:MAG: hypothetical protein M3P27_12265, partial [Acidobacteriota bacterium]|nr:hypothetical protein [Acidobacteriota bacterium]